MKKSLVLVVVLTFTSLALAANIGPTAWVTIEQRASGEPSTVEIRLEPDIGNREVFLSLLKGRRLRGEEAYWHRRRLQAVEPGLYRLDYVFPESGVWNVFVHYGTGLAGLEASSRVQLDLEPGTVETSMRFRYYPNGAERLPSYIQSLGYASVGLLAAVTLFALGRILLRLREQLDA